jgi:ATP-dependent RNA helicase DDX24/MAK5
MGMDELVMLDANGKVMTIEAPPFVLVKHQERKRKLFLASATLLQVHRGMQKFQVKIQKRKKKKRLSEQEEKEEFNLKMQALMQKIKFFGKPKIIDLTTNNLFPKFLTEYKTLCMEDDKFLYLFNYILKHKDESFIVFNNSVTYANKVA